MAFAWTKDTGGTLNTNFIAAYNLESSAGTDDKGGFTLTTIGTPAYNAGKNGLAADGGLANVGNSLFVSSNLGISGSNFSVSVWVNVTTAPTVRPQTISMHQDGTLHVGYFIYYLDVTGTKTVRFRRDKGGVAAVNKDSATTLTTGTWFHLILTWNGSVIEGFINGASQGTAAATGNGSAGTSQVNILDSDSSGTANELMSGLIDATYYWSKKLSATEISDLYNGGAGSFYTQATATPNLPLLNVG